MSAVQINLPQIYSVRFSSRSAVAVRAGAQEVRWEERLYIVAADGGANYCTFLGPVPAYYSVRINPRTTTANGRARVERKAN